MKHISKLIILLAILLSSNAWGSSHLDSHLFDAAAGRGQAGLVKYLIWAGADVNAKDEDHWGGTPLMISVYYSNLETIKVLIQHGADVNAQNEEGETALFAAARTRNYLIAKFLLDHGADVNHRANGGMGHTALTIAAGGDNDNWFLRLLAKTADLDNINNAIKVASRYPHYHRWHLEVLNKAKIATITSVEKVSKNLLRINISARHNNIKMFKIEYRTYNHRNWPDVASPWKSYIISGQSKNFYLFMNVIPKVELQFRIQSKDESGWIDETNWNGFYNRN